MTRGFDVYGFENCNALMCVSPIGVQFEVDPQELVDPVTGLLP